MLKLNLYSFTVYNILFNFFQSLNRILYVVSFQDNINAFHNSSITLPLDGSYDLYLNKEYVFLPTDPSKLAHVNKPLAKELIASLQEEMLTYYLKSRANLKITATEKGKILKNLKRIIDKESRLVANSELIQKIEEEHPDSNEILSKYYKNYELKLQSIQSKVFECYGTNLRKYYVHAKALINILKSETFNVKNKSIIEDLVSSQEANFKKIILSSLDNIHNIFLSAKSDQNRTNKVSSRLSKAEVENIQQTVKKKLISISLLPKEIRDIEDNYRNITDKCMQALDIKITEGSSLLKNKHLKKYLEFWNKITIRFKKPDLSLSIERYLLASLVEKQLSYTKEKQFTQPSFSTKNNLTAGKRTWTERVNSTKKSNTISR